MFINTKVTKTTFINKNLQKIRITPHKTMLIIRCPSAAFWPHSEMSYGRHRQQARRYPSEAK